MGIKEELDICRRTGKLIIGGKGIIKDLSSRAPKSKLIIISNNCPKQIEERIKLLSEFSNIPTLKFDVKSIELGKALKKHFFVSALSIVDPGDSSILKISKEGES